MYAPKFRSWMTDWDRFDEALAHRLDAMAEDAMAEIHAMVEKAMPPKKPEYQTAGVYYAGNVGYSEVGTICIGIGGWGDGGGGGVARAISQEEIRIRAQQQAAYNSQNQYLSGLGALGSVGNLFGSRF